MASIRKEQALFVIALVFGYWMYTGIETFKKPKPVRA